MGGVSNMTEEEEQKYDVLEKIGQGSFGVIRKVRRKADNAILCRKEISYGRMGDRERTQLAAELDILKTLRHPNIVQYYSREHIKSSSDIYLYMEYCGNGDLGGYIKKLKEGNRLADEGFVWDIFAQLVSALYRCHTGLDAPPPGQESVKQAPKMLQTKTGHRIVLHRDLKPENVFLGKNNAVKLGDFGLSKIIASHDFASTYVGTPFYMSPEICAAERYSGLSDVWSLGCIIYELASRNVPFDARTQVELVMKIRAGRVKQLPDVYSRELWEVISWCLKVNPRDRPSTEDLLKIPQIRAARAKLEQTHALDIAAGEKMRLVQERDSAVAKLNAATKQIQELQQEIQTMREAGKKVEMEWHARATLAIDQQVADAEKKHKADLERHKADLLQQFDSAVDKKVDEKLRLHSASLPQAHGLGPTQASHVRSGTPPPGKSQSSISTNITNMESDGSSVVLEQDGSALETEISSLSIMEEVADDVSPLAQRTKPPPKPRIRQPFGRAKTLANCSNFEVRNTDSPMDVHMADPSPMPSHAAPPMSIKGLSLSPRRNQDRAGGAAGLRKNIFALANEPRLRPTVPADVDSSFADDDFDDDLDAVEDSPSRPASGLSNPATNGDPFKAFAVQPSQPPKRVPRPSLGRQQTLPVNMQPAIQTRQRTGLFGAAPVNRKLASPDKEKENRPPSSQGRTGVPALSGASPKRGVPAMTRDGKILTPSRKAPPPPTTGGLPKANTASNLVKLAQAHNILSPGKGSGVKGRTLVELQQARAAISQPELVDEHGAPVIPDGAGLMAGARLLPSPAKWDERDCEDMPSPFLAKKGRPVR